MRKALAFLLIAAVLITSAFSADAGIPIKVLLLPKFENGEMSGDFPGEAQYYYEAYTQGGDEYEIKGGMPGSKLYVKDGVAIYVTGMGKVNTAMSLNSILLDPRFDFSDCYFISTGCAGSATEYSVMGDVFVITAAIDYDLGHHADPREMELMDKVYNLVKDVEIETTDKTRAFMAYTFDNADWAVRDPKVLRGTTVSGDNYWKGAYDQQNAISMCEVYDAPDPFALSEMEDVALAVVLDRFGLLDRYIIIRDSVNMVVFMNGVTPEGLWNPTRTDESLSDEDSIEAADIFATAMENNFKVGSVVVDAILDGTL